ncbi:MAG: beta-eliminating lyase-related protein [Lachnospiraceae bacterium]|nr:beta-eliminating lyase-related protein [Lachnospiraceae bacterium]
MWYFDSDYLEGAHPKILERLLETNLEQTPGYGEDRYCASAKDKIRAACDCPDADIYFTTGGTQTNALVIDSLLHSYEGVVSAQTGHVNAHESGAVEFTGHKVLTLPQYQGKISSADLSAYLEKFWKDENREHMVFPGMVYISHPTEYGALYTKAELTAIHDVCAAYHIPLYLDGARLGCGLMSRGTDVTLSDLSRLCDVFYIGGTKVGALFGEAVVFTHANTPAHFTALIKQHGALLAKGRMLGIQFDTLFTDGLYYEISAHAIEMAGRLKDLFVKKGYELFMDSPTNQQFIILENDLIERLKKEVSFSYWEPFDDHRSVVRFATSWATSEKQLKALEQLI